MYVQRIVIENVKSFGISEDASDDASIELDLERPDGTYAGWTVLAGRNGAGKSTFLQAVALAMAGPEAARTLNESWANWIRQGASSGYVAVNLLVHAADAFVDRGRTPVNSTFWASLQWRASESGPEPVMSPQSFRGWSVRTAERGPWGENPSGWLVVGYGPFRRVSSASGDAVRLMTAPGHVARLVSLFREDASLAESVRWLESIYVRRLERGKEWAQLEADVIRLLNSGLLPDGFVVERIDSEGLWIRQGDILLPLRELRDGYRTVAALILDIVRHVFLSYGSLDLITGPDGTVHIPHAGVVLIDEIDAHLHVSWQQRIGFWLKDHFPQMQFIVSTHSPFICQAADARGLIRLPSPDDPGPPRHVSDELFLSITRGSADEATMSELFGLDHTHSPQSERIRRRVSELEAQLLHQPPGGMDESPELRALRAELPDSASAAVDQAWRLLALELDEAPD